MNRILKKIICILGVISLNTSISASLKVTVPISERNIYSVLDLHNRVRCQVDTHALTMPAMTWNNTLYQVAQNFANKCVFQHNSNATKEYESLGGKGYVGENIFAIWTSSNKIFFPNAILSFASEKPNFSYASSCSSGICGCKGDCLHYTQLIWADSVTVACAQSDCTNTPLGAKFVVCDYSPGGNYVGRPPYKASTSFINTEACKLAKRLPLKFVTTLDASSGLDKLLNVFDENLATYWTPLKTDEPPYMILKFEQPLNVDELRIRWSDLQHSARVVSIEYATKVDGSGAINLPPQSLEAVDTAYVFVKQNKIRYLKISFLERRDLKVRVSRLRATDPTFSMVW